MARSPSAVSRSSSSAKSSAKAKHRARSISSKTSSVKDGRRVDQERGTQWLSSAAREEEIIMDLLLTCGGGGPEGKELGPLVFEATEEEENITALSFSSPHQRVPQEVAARRIRQLLSPLEALIHALEKELCTPREALHHVLAILRAGLRQPIEERPQLLLSMPSYPTTAGGERKSVIIHPTRKSIGNEKDVAKRGGGGAEPATRTLQQERKEEEEMEEGLKRFSMVREAWESASTPEGAQAMERLQPALRPHNVVYHQLVSSRSIPLAAMVEGLHAIAYISVKLRIELLCLLLRRALQREGEALTQRAQHTAMLKAAASGSSISRHKNEKKEKGNPSLVDHNAGPSSQAKQEEEIQREKELIEDQLASLLVTETLLVDFISYYTNVVRYVGMTGAMRSRGISEGGAGAACAAAVAAAAGPSEGGGASTASTLGASSSTAAVSSGKTLEGTAPSPLLHPSTGAVKATLIRQYYELSDWILLVETASEIPPIALSQITRAHLPDMEKEGGGNTSSSSSSPSISAAGKHRKKEGRLIMELRRPSTTTPWGILFTQTGRLLDVDVAMRVGSRSKEVHELLQRTDGGARIVSVNGHRLPPPPSPSSVGSTGGGAPQKKSKKKGGEAAKPLSYADRVAAYHRQVLQQMHQLTFHSRKMVLEVSSPAFTFSAMRDRPRELLFYVPFQGGEAAAGQRACIVLHRRDATHIPWSFAIEQRAAPQGTIHALLPTEKGSTPTAPAAPTSLPVVLWHPPTPGTPGAALFSDACRRFLKAFPQRLQLVSVNGVGVQTAGQAAALMQSAHTVMLQLVVRPPVFSPPVTPTTAGSTSPPPRRGLPSPSAPKRSTKETHGAGAGEGDHQAGSAFRSAVEETPASTAAVEDTEDTAGGMKKDGEEPMTLLVSSASTAPTTVTEANTASTAMAVVPKTSPLFPSLPSLGEIAMIGMTSKGKKEQMKTEKKGSVTETNAAVQGRAVTEGAARHEDSSSQETPKGKRSKTPSKASKVTVEEKRAPSLSSADALKSVLKSFSSRAGDASLEGKTSTVDSAEKKLAEGKAKKGKRTPTKEASALVLSSSSSSSSSTASKMKNKTGTMEVPPSAISNGVEEGTTSARVDIKKARGEPQKHIQRTLSTRQEEGSPGKEKKVASATAAGVNLKTEDVRQLLSTEASKEEVVERETPQARKSITKGKGTEKKKTTTTKTNSGEGEEEVPLPSAVVVSDAAAPAFPSSSSLILPCEFENSIRILALDEKELVIERPSTKVPWGLPIEKRPPRLSSSSSISHVSSKKKTKTKKTGKEEKGAEGSGAVESMPPEGEGGLVEQHTAWPLALSELPKPLFTPAAAWPSKGLKQGTSVGDGKRRNPSSLVKTKTKGGGTVDAPLVSSTSSLDTHPFIQRFYAHKEWPIVAINGVTAKNPNKAISLMRSLTKMTLRFAR